MGKIEPGGRSGVALIAISAVALVLNAAAIIWKGGELSGKFDALLKRVGEISGQLRELSRDYAGLTNEVWVQRQRLNDYEKRIERLESARR